MKKTIYSILLLAASSLAFTSCSDWLDVNPKTEVRESKLFSSESGYHDAVAGVYILIGQKDLYGMQSSMYVPEFLAHTWTIPTDQTDATAHYLGENDYTNNNVESALDAMWSKYYNAIAQINDVLANIEHTNVHFSGNQKQLIQGEMYGLRAFLHLDLMRYFGPVPDGANGSASCIPYAKEMTTDVAKLKCESYDAVKADILADLDKAESLLADTDPLVKTIYSRDASNSDSNVDLTNNELYRQLHFNYWAVLGTKARFYYWTGDKQKAVEYAKKVIEAKDEAGNTLFSLCSEAYFSKYSNACLNMKVEQLFGAYNSNFQTEVQTPYYMSNNPLFSQKEEYVKTAYESSLYPDDVRNKGTRYWKTDQDEGSSTSSYHYYKYRVTGSTYGPNTVPLIRLSEMYFILFEDDSLDAMKPYFTTWRLAKGLDSSLDGTLTSESAVEARMEKEWRKEFMGEGQMFFFYKKHGTQTYTWPTIYNVPAGAYQLPLPKSQSMYE